MDIFKYYRRPNSAHSDQNTWAVAHGFAWRNECFRELFLWFFFSVRAVWHHLFLIGRARGGLGTWSWCPPPSPPHPRVHVPRAAPQLVIGWHCTSPHGDEGHLHFWTRSGRFECRLNVLIAYFRTELIFLQIIAVCFQYNSGLPGRSAHIHEVGSRIGEEFERQLLLRLQIGKYTDSASKKRR